MKNKLFTFFSLGIPLLSVFFIIILFLSGKIEAIDFKSFLFALLIASINFLIGFLAIKIGISKPNKKFLMIVFGAVVIRFFLIFIMIILTISFLYVRLNSFIFTTFTYYFYYLIIEILYLKNLKIVVKNE